MVLTRIGSVPGSTRFTPGTPPSGGILEHRQRAVVHEVHRRDRIVGQPLLGVGVPQRDQLVRTRVRQGAQHHGIDNGEHRSCGAGPQTKHQHGDEGECWMLPELAHRQPNRAHHVEAPSAGRLRDEIGARGLKTIGMLRGVTLQHGKCGLFERGHRASLCLVGRGAFFEGGGVQVLEIGDHLVQRGVGQHQSRLRDATLDCVTEVDGGFHGYAGLTPATCVSAVMNRAQSSRCVASMARPPSVIR